MKLNRTIYLALSVCLVSGVLGSCDADNTGPADGGDEPHTGQQIVVGIEYVPIDNASLSNALAQHFVETSVQAVKPLPGNFDWGKMVSAPGAEPNTSQLDAFVKEWQNQTFRILRGIKLLGVYLKLNLRRYLLLLTLGKCN